MTVNGDTGDLKNWDSADDDEWEGIGEDDEKVPATPWNCVSPADTTSNPVDRKLSLILRCKDGVQPVDADGCEFM